MGYGVSLMSLLLDITQNYHTNTDKVIGIRYCSLDTIQEETTATIWCLKILDGTGRWKEDFRGYA